MRNNLQANINDINLNSHEIGFTLYDNESNSPLTWKRLSNIASDQIYDKFKGGVDIDIIDSILFNCKIREDNIFIHIDDKHIEEKVEIIKFIFSSSSSDLKEFLNN